MRVTVCELHDDRRSLDADWEGLSDHCRKQRSELVLLPEMPFTPWLPRTEAADEGKWLSAVIEHESWRKAFTDLVPAQVLSTQPIVDAQNHYNEGFSWTAVGGSRPVHRKYYLPNEPGFWEANWYRRGDLNFAPCAVEGLVIGFMICTELWFTEHARSYATAGVNILAAPRATGIASNEKWLAGGRTAAIMSGAFCLSSNRAGADTAGFEWGGQGWIIEPEEGEILAVTSPTEPFVTVDLDLDVAEQAKMTYPRYVAE